MNRRSASLPKTLPTPRDRRILAGLLVHVRLTARQIRLLWFRKNGDSATPQTVNARLRKLAAGKFVTQVTVDLGRGAGPSAYGLGPGGYDLLGVPQWRHRGRPGPVHHHLAVAEFRVALDQALRAHRGRIVEWVGEPQLRGLIRSRTAPFPDALVHWRLVGREGVFFLEMDRGSEPLAVLTAKLGKYADFMTRRGHRQLLAGLGLKPRLVFVAGPTRSRRLVRFLEQHQPAITTFVGVEAQALGEPLGRRWWRSDLMALGSLVH